uniref:SFRICE_026981 n=1 Tax=Spodoptera frugiperda TaxID=7108 RepID=A0A2H1W0G7_SPOFR
MEERAVKSDELFLGTIRGLNVQQRDLFQKVSAAIENDLQRQASQLLLFIMGGADSGKSFLLKLIVAHIKRCYAPTVDILLKPNFVEVQVRCRELKVDDLVLIKDDRTPPLCWRLGRVSKLFPGTDGVPRVADVSISQGTVRRAINRLCLVKKLDEKPNRSEVDERLILAFQAARDKMLKHYKKSNWIYC